jgi:bacterial/archaeal transporter family protein
MFESWLGLALVALAVWGAAGIFLKLATNQLSAGSSLIWLIAGFLLLGPLLWPGRELLGYSFGSVLASLAAGFLNALAFWTFLAAMRDGGKASVVVPLTALYPIPVVLLAPLLFDESLTTTQAMGVALGLGAVVLLSLEDPPEARQ